MNELKTILVLPGTKWQLPLVKKIKQEGHRVVVVNPVSDSPCFEFADNFLQADIFDWEKVVEFGRKEKIDAILSDQCDIAMNLIADLGKEFTVPALSPEMASLYTNKFLMREFCRQISNPCPEYKICKIKEEAVKFFLHLDKPVIIKPLDSNASHGVFKCETTNDIFTHFDESKSFSRKDSSVLVEQYINGTEFTIDGIKTPNGHFTLAISEKKHFKHNPSIANELYFTHYNPNFDYEELKKVNDNFINSSELEWGFTHAEYKYEDGKFYLIEIAARGGGNMISSCITQHMSGYDTYHYLIACALGNIEEQNYDIPLTHKEKAAVLKFFDTPNNGGIVKRIDGIDFVENHPDIKYYKFNFKEGDTIKNALNDSARIGFYIACSENEEKLNAIMKEVEDKVKIIV